MSNPCITSIKVITIFGLALGFVVMNRISASMRVVAQANASQNSTVQQGEPFDQKQKLAEITKRIAGQENRPAEEVFKNIQLLKGMPAARLLSVMEVGFSRSLGVDCTHCHVVDQWEKDDKPTKQIARDMFNMMQAINNTYLKNIKNLKSARPTVNCTTCHRGQTKPETNLPEIKRKQ